MAAFAAAAFENELIFKKIRLYGLEPTQELFVIFWVFLRKICPLPAEILGRFGLIGFDLRKIDKARHAADDLVFTRAFLARQNAFDNFLIVVFAGVRQQNIAAASRAGKEV